MTGIGEKEMNAPSPAIGFGAPSTTDA